MVEKTWLSSKSDDFLFDLFRRGLAPEIFVSRANVLTKDTAKLGFGPAPPDKND